MHLTTWIRTSSFIGRCKSKEVTVYRHSTTRYDAFIWSHTTLLKARSSEPDPKNSAPKQVLDMSQTPSPHAAILSDHEDKPYHSSPRRTRHRDRRGHSRTPRSLSTGSDDDYPTQRHSQKTKGGLPAVDDTRAVLNTPRDTANKLAETVAKNAASGDQDSTLSLRLDLNLDVYIKLTAKIHGDITLTLL